MYCLCSAKAVANHFLELAWRDGTTLNPIQIQKLVYIAHGWHLAITEKPLIHESVEAWTYGPVIPDLYHEFKQWGNEGIQEHATEIRISSGPGDPLLFREDVPSVDGECPDPAEVKALLGRVWEVYKRFSAVQLSDMTHREGTPWDVTWKKNNGKRSVSIDDSVIYKHFRELGEQNVNRKIQA